MSRTKLVFLFLLFVATTNAQSFNNPLLRAIKNRDLELVKQLIAKGQDVNVCEQIQYSNPCVNSSQVTFNQLLLKKSFFQIFADSLVTITVPKNEVSISTVDGIKCVYEEIEAPAVNEVFLCNPLLLAIDVEDTSIVNILLASGAKLNSACEYKNRTSILPIHFVFDKLQFCTSYEDKKKGEAILQSLLKHNCNLNSSTAKKYDTPIHNAIRLGDAKLLKQLVDMGAGFDYAESVNNNGSILEFAIKLSYATNNEILSYLYQQNLKTSNDTMLFYALDIHQWSNDYSLHLNKGLNINCKYEGKYHCLTPLCYALKLGDVESARSLISAEVDLQLCNPLDYAISSAKKYSQMDDIVSELMSKKAGVSSTEKLVSFVVNSNLKNADSLLALYKVDSNIIQKYKTEKVQKDSLAKADKIKADEQEQAAIRQKEYEEENSFRNKVNSKIYIPYDTWFLSASVLRMQQNPAFEISFAYQDENSGTGYFKLDKHIDGPFFGCELMVDKKNQFLAPKIGYDYYGVLFGYKVNLLYYNSSGKSALVFRPELGLSLLKVYLGIGYNFNINGYDIIHNSSTVTFTVNFPLKWKKKEVRYY